MDLLALAVPSFLLALLLELGVDRVRGTGYYRANDAINSLSAGSLMTTFGYFTKFVAVFIWGYVLQHFAIYDMAVAWFDSTPRGIALWTLAMLGWHLCYCGFWRAQAARKLESFLGQSAGLCVPVVRCGAHTTLARQSRHLVSPHWLAAR